MSQETAELARQAAEAIAVGDLDAYFESFHPNVVYHTRADEPDATTYRGLEDYKSFFLTSWLATFEHFRPDIQEIVDAGERTITVVLLRGRGRSSGVEVSEPYAFLRTWRDGRTVEVHEYRTKAEALAAAGLAA